MLQSIKSREFIITSCLILIIIILLLRPHTSVLKTQIQKVFLVAQNKTTIKRQCDFTYMFIATMRPDAQANFKMAVYKHADLISQRIKSQQTWEAHLLAHVMAELRRDSNLHFIDVGANIGVYALSAMSLGRKVMVVDANDKNLNLIHCSVSLNSWSQDRITYVNSAVSDKRGKLYLSILPSNIGGSPIDFSIKNDKQFAKWNKPGWNKTAVQAILMDDLLPKLNFKKAFFKIDVEFSEGRAFKVARKLFETIDIRFIMMEAKVNGLTNPSLNDIVKFLASLNYGVFQQLQPRQSLKGIPVANWGGDIFFVKGES